MSRGSYKRYEYDLDAHIPRTTVYNRRKSKHAEVYSTMQSGVNVSNGSDEYGSVTSANNPNMAC